MRWAVSGLLAICLLLAGGLGLTGYLNYKAAARAAQDILYSRASELGAAFISAARWTGALFEEQRLGPLAGEMAVDGSSIVVLSPEGQILARGGPLPEGAAGSAVNIPATLFADLRLQGQHQRLVTASHLEYWRPLGPGHGPGFGRRWRGAFGQPGTGAPPDAAGKLPPAGPPWAFRQGGPRLRLLRVTIPMAAARSLAEPAKITVTLAGVSSLALLVLGILLFRAARRAQLVEAELQRRRALAALGEMAAILAHEIRTPLASIKGNAQLIGEALPDDERARSMVSEAARLEHLVNGLLDYARPVEPRRLACDPDALAERAAQIVALKAASSRVDLVTDPAGCGPCLRADPDQLLQVLVNLLQNAVEASAQGPEPPSGPVVVRVRRGGGRVSFTVLDSGPGLPAASTDELFRPFFSTKRQGTGLGLAVARQIVEQHGGELELHPRKEGGALACVRLPEGGR